MYSNSFYPFISKPTRITSHSATLIDKIFSNNLDNDKFSGIPGMALGFFNLGPGTRMFGQIGVPSIFGGSQNLGDSLREKEYVLDYEKERVTNLELILTHMHMHRTGRQRLFLEPLHSFLLKNSVNERAPFPRVYFLRSNEQ